MRYWISIDKSLQKDDADQLWRKIEKYHANLLVTESDTCVYGEASENAIKDILYHCAIFEHNIQLNIN